MLNVNLPKDKTQIYQVIAGIAAVTAILAGCLIILSPFFPAILLATIFALSGWPAFHWLNHRLGGRTRLSAGLMTLALAACFIVPLVIIGTSAAENFGKTYKAIESSLSGDTQVMANNLQTIPYVGDTLSRLWTELTSDQEMLAATMTEYAGSAKENIIKIGASVGRGLVDLTLGVLLAYFFFRHGTRAAVRIGNLIDTFGGERGRHLLEVSKNTLIGAVYGILGTAVAQGLLAAFGFWIAGIPGASFLGLMTFFLSFVPAGPPLIWLPAVIWLFGQGQTWPAIFLLFWGLLLVSAIDNFLRPHFISRHNNLPFLLVLLGVVGGVIAYGFIGIFIGPTLLALAYVLILEWSHGRISAKPADKEES